MCAGCGGSCSRPRFVTPAGGAEMRVIGTNMGPAMQPGHLVHQLPGVVAYRTLYTGLSPNGEPASTILPGSYGQTFGAGRGRRG